MPGTELDVLGALLSGTELEVLGAVLSGAELDVLGAVLLGAVLDELVSATDDVLAAVEATLPDVEATDTDELDPTVFGTDDAGGGDMALADRRIERGDVRVAHLVGEGDQGVAGEDALDRQVLLAHGADYGVLALLDRLVAAFLGEPGADLVAGAW